MIQQHPDTMQASGSGRRARAPSRKLLEASGALKDEGAQWMTREIKEADAKVKKELREKRRHFKAAGLKAGEVMEAFTVPQAGTEIEGGKAGSGDGSSGSQGGLPNKQSWRVQTQDPGKQQQRITVGGSAATANISSTKEAVEAVSPAASDRFPRERAWVMFRSDTAARKGRSVTFVGDGTTAPAPKRKKRGRDDHGREDGEGAVSAAMGSASTGEEKEREGCADAVESGGKGYDRTKCDYGDCSKTASFGVNGTVRYW